MRGARAGRPRLASGPVTAGEIREYLRTQRLAVVATRGTDGAPQAALVGIAVTDALEIVFDTVTTSRKHRNLRADPRVAVTFGGSDERTLQYEGIAAEVSTAGAADAAYRTAYYRAWPDGHERLAWPDLCYWRISPRWLRFSDYSAGPRIVERRWPHAT